MPNEFLEYMEYVKKLEFEEEPNYLYIRNIFKSIANRLKTFIIYYLLFIINFLLFIIYYLFNCIKIFLWIW